MTSADERSLWGHEGHLKYSGYASQQRKPELNALPWRGEGDLSMEEVARLWRDFTQDISSQELGSEIAVFAAWQRDRQTGEAESRVPVRLRRVPDINLRIGENQSLVQAAKPHLKRFSTSLNTSKHVVCITDADGVLLDCVGNDTVLKVYGMLPGYDWSEAVMGTNGAGTALALGCPVAVLGPDYYQLPFRDSACFGAPITNHSGELVGAVDLRVHIRDVRAEHLKGVLSVSEAIQQSLA
jgi:transcriptional regulator of acetoin/glycerol metabolism